MSFPESQALLHFNQVSFSYPSQTGDIHILKQASFRLSAGQSLSLTGPSGSGKTSLLLLAAGLETPQTGEILLNDIVLSNKNEQERAALRRKYLGIIFQNFHLIPTLTALENVALPLDLAGHQDAYDIARHELDAVGLSHRLDHLPSHLSGGEQQRVAIARAFAPNPHLILADEPTGNLDPETGQMITDLLFDRLKQGRNSLILITHDWGLAEKCDQQITLSHGEVKSHPRSQLIVETAKVSGRVSG